MSNGNLLAIASKSKKEQERATTIAFAIVGWAITLEREKKQRKLRAINLQGAIETNVDWYKIFTNLLPIHRSASS